MGLRVVVFASGVLMRFLDLFFGVVASLVVTGMNPPLLSSVDELTREWI